MTLGPAALTDDQRLAWLRLIRSDNIGPVTFRELINHFGSAAEALAAVPDLARKGGRQIRLASVEDADYPPWLRAIDGAPPLIAVRGGGAPSMARSHGG